MFETVAPEKFFPRSRKALYESLPVSIALHVLIVLAIMFSALWRGEFPSMSPKLLALYSVDPCVALIPILIAAGSLGWPSIIAIILAYEIACLTTMVGLVLPARAGARMIQAKWLERWEHAAAGVFIAVVGVVVGILGI